MNYSTPSLTLTHMKTYLIAIGFVFAVINVSDRLIGIPEEERHALGKQPSRNICRNACREVSWFIKMCLHHYIFDHFIFV